MRLRRRRATTAPALKTVRHDPPAPAPAPTDLRDIEAQARYHRDRLALYRARMHGPHPTSTVRLGELEHAASAAADRLRTARRQAEGDPPA